MKRKDRDRERLILRSILLCVLSVHSVHNSKISVSEESEKGRTVTASSWFIVILACAFTEVTEVHKKKPRGIRTTQLQGGKSS